MGDQEVLDRIVFLIRSLFKTSEGIRCDLDNPTSPHHLLWVCNQIPAADLNKKTQWLSFLLAVMIINGLVDIENEREIIKQVLG